MTTTRPLPAVRDFAAIAETYARDVVDGRIVACQWVKRACQRHLADRTREGTATFPFRFDAAAGARVCKFVELLPHTKGKWAIGRPGKVGSNLIRLEPWQIFILVVLFGWLHVATGKRRFRKAYICVPRKNGKSIIAGGIGLFMFAADHEYGAEVYSGATTEKQAWEVFRPARLMAVKTPEFCDAFGVEVGAKNLHVPDNGSRFEPVIGKPGDGASPSCAIVDEYHEHETDELVDTMVTGMGAREQPLLLVITTSGTNLEAPCYAMQLDVQKVLAGTVVDEELFGIIYTIDDGDDWTSEAALRKANPNYDISISGDFLRAQIALAQRSARKQNTIKTKHLNIWCNARSAWMNMEAWAACLDPEMREEDFDGEPAWLALDLASKLDLTAKAKVFTREVEGVPHYFAFVKSYLPEDAAADPTKAHYAGWVEEGHLETTDGNVVDYEVIADALRDDARQHQVVAIGYDPWNAQQLANEMLAEGLPMVEVPQRTTHLSEPMKELEAAVIAKRFHHDGNPVLTWAMSNVVVKPDPNDNVFPRKERAEGKIDPAVALILAVGRAIAGDGEGGSVYDNAAERPNGFLTL